MLELSAWNGWLQRINESTEEELERELDGLMTGPALPFVEQNLRLGYLYFAKDCLGAATTAFRKVASAVEREKDNPEFVRENQDGLWILQTKYRAERDICGNIKIEEVGECGCCAPMCCCFGAAAVMAVCGIDLENITNCGGSGEPGCLDDFMNNCCRCCCVCVNCHWMDP